MSLSLAGDLTLSQSPLHCPRHHTNNTHSPISIRWGWFRVSEIISVWVECSCLLIISGMFLINKYLYLFSRLYFCVEEGAFFSLGSLLFVLSKQMSEQPGQRHVSGPLSHSGLCCFSHCHHQSANTRRQNQRNILHMVQFEFSPSTYRKPCVSSIFGRIPISNFHSLG